MTYTIYAITKIIEQTQVEASSKKEALSKVLNSPENYDWNECGELEVEYEAN